MKTKLVSIFILSLLSISISGETLLGAPSDKAKRRQAVRRGLDWLAKTQELNGRWTAPGNQYPTAMTALAGNAMLAEGSTAMQGRYAKNIKRAVNYLQNLAEDNEGTKSEGLIGNPKIDDRYTYGHGFSMLFLSQVLGEEEDPRRREALVELLTKAVKFTCDAQTKAGGWGYVSAKDGSDFDEGSTTITQVQGLRACRNAGIQVPDGVIEKAVKYIHGCTGKDGGVFYSSKSRGSGRPPITAAAVACLFNAGEYKDKNVAKMLAYCKKNIGGPKGNGGGHWHYSHYYYAQVLYRQGGQEWDSYKKEMYEHLLGQVSDNGAWADNSGYGPVFGTAISLTILQLDNAVLPIYQR